MPENQAKFFSGLKVADGRATGAIVNSILVIPSLVCTCWHFYELSEQPSGRSKGIAIIEEIGNLSSYIGRVLYAIAVNDPDEETRLLPIGLMGLDLVVLSGLNAATAVFQI